LAKRVSRIGTNLLSELSTEGLTAEILSTLQQTAIDFDEALGRQEDALANRNLHSYLRIASGNNLYAEIVRVASIGKSLFGDTHEAKYNDYVLYDEKNNNKNEVRQIENKSIAA
ncbi:MAG TPA: hypothetical protein VN958_03840, partial [Chitinophagaceae bacterium]|nr:hypothetical protein [Chitinophagaceae bacterium]